MSTVPPFHLVPSELFCRPLPLVVLLLARAMLSRFRKRILGPSCLFSSCIQRRCFLALRVCTSNNLFDLCPSVQYRLIRMSIDLLCRPVIGQSNFVGKLQPRSARSRRGRATRAPTWPSAQSFIDVPLYNISLGVESKAHRFPCLIF